MSRARPNSRERRNKDYYTRNDEGLKRKKSAKRLIKEYETEIKTSMGNEIINGERNVKYIEDEEGVISAGNKLYHPIRTFRDNKLGNTRILNYYCKLHRRRGKTAYKLIGQMETVARHYVKEHPKRITDIKHIIAKADFLLSRCRVYLDKLDKCPSQYIVDFDGNLRNVLTKMVFDWKTFQFLDDYFAGKYTGNKPAGYSNVDYNILKSYLLVCKEHIEKFLDFLKKEKCICPSDEESKKYLLDIKFEDFVELDLYKTSDKQAFFFISEMDQREEKEEEEEEEGEEINTNINNKAKDKDSFEEQITKLQKILKEMDNCYNTENLIQIKNDLNLKENILTKDFEEYMENRELMKKWKKSVDFVKKMKRKYNLEKYVVLKGKNFLNKKSKRSKRKRHKKALKKKRTKKIGLKRELIKTENTISLIEEEEDEDNINNIKELKPERGLVKTKKRGKKRVLERYINRRRNLELNNNDKDNEEESEFNENKKILIELRSGDLDIVDNLNLQEPKEQKENKEEINTITKKNNIIEEDIYDKDPVFPNKVTEIKKEIKDIIHMNKKPENNKENKIEEEKKQELIKNNNNNDVNIDVNNDANIDVNKESKEKIISEKNNEIVKEKENKNELEKKVEEKKVTNIKDNNVIVNEKETEVQKGKIEANIIYPNKPNDNEKAIEEKSNVILDNKKKEGTKSSRSQSSKKDNIQKQSNLDNFIKKELKQPKPIFSLNDVIKQFNMEFNKLKTKTNEDNNKTIIQSKMELRSHGKK